VLGAFLFGHAGSLRLVETPLDFQTAPLRRDLSVGSWRNIAITLIDPGGQFSISGHRLVSPTVARGIDVDCRTSASVYSYRVTLKLVEL
jgi:hypothetical protein